MDKTLTDNGEASYLKTTLKKVFLPCTLCLTKEEDKRCKCGHKRDQHR
jgi:hypothetical protein